MEKSHAATSAEETAGSQAQEQARTAEAARIRDHRERRANWKNWGPYLSERAWGTVREDYSAGGTAWDYFPHDHARSRAYRWGEDGIGGISDRYQQLCMSVALWNGQDPILKERLFGLTGEQGNHGEDVKEYYYYLDATPTHSYLKMLYKYPQRCYPYQELVDENARRTPMEPEYELMDSGVFEEDRYFDVFIEHAKLAEDELLTRIRVVNRGPEPAECRLLPTVWFRNTWDWGYPAGPLGETPRKPQLRPLESAPAGSAALFLSHPSTHTGEYYWYAADADELLITENETNYGRLFGHAGTGAAGHGDSARDRRRKDGFHEYVVHGDTNAVSKESGTKGAALYRLSLEAGASRDIYVRLGRASLSAPFDGASELIERRRQEADAFYEDAHASGLDEESRRIQRQAFAGLVWSKQFFYYDVEQWLEGDPGQPSPPAERRHGRNSAWRHLTNFDIISMPDKWEYPWYASWDLAFHCLPLAMIDPDFAKRQLTLMTREWYTHPNGQLPAYEWSFDDVNPPVHAWATWRVFKVARKATGEADYAFLEDVFHKLLLNFTWWVNRKDVEGRNIFEGGFLGLDNISVFDRSSALPTGGHIHQSDGTAWMGFFSLMMLKMALELAKRNPTYQNIASKFFEHFLRIAEAMTADRREGPGLWNNEDGFFYDVLHIPGQGNTPLKVRSLVGLLPLIAVESLDSELLERLPEFHRRMQWFYDNKVYLKENGHIACTRTPGQQERRLLSLVNETRLRQVLIYMLDETEFLSPYGIRSVSRFHRDHPYSFSAGGEEFSVSYQPAESESGMFGGNSNWRGPIWFPINFLIIEALQRFHHYYGDAFTVELPTGSGNMHTLEQVAGELSRRLTSIFHQDADGRRPLFGGNERFQSDPHWRDYILFHEYFHGDNGAGIGASHQTGWTALVAKLLQQTG